MALYSEITTSSPGARIFLIYSSRHLARHTIHAHWMDLEKLAVNMNSRFNNTKHLRTYENDPEATQTLSKIASGGIRTQGPGVQLETIRSERQTFYLCCNINIRSTISHNLYRVATYYDWKNIPQIIYICSYNIRGQR